MTSDRRAAAGGTLCLASTRTRARTGRSPATGPAARDARRPTSARSSALPPARTGLGASLLASSLLAGSLLAGCDEGAPGGDEGALEVVDSAGVEIVRDARPEAPLSLREVMRVGVLEGDPDHEFDRVRTVAPDPDGGFWVVDADPSLRRYDADGRFAARAGGAGEGPGEADGYFAVIPGEGWIAASASPPTLQRFRSDGVFLDSRPSRLEEGGTLRLLGRAEDRMVLTVQRLPLGSGGSHSLDTGGEPLVRSSIEVVTAPDSLSPVTSVRTFVGSSHTAQGASGPYVLGDPSFAADGRGRIHVSDTLAYRVETYDLEGRLRRVVERPLPPRAFPEGFEEQLRAGVEQTFEEGIDGLIPAGMTPQRMEQVERIVAGSTPPRTPPHLRFIDRVLATPEGTLWVERADRHPRIAMRAVAEAFGYVRWAWHPEWKAPQVFDLFRPDGTYRGTVELPFDYVPMSVAGDRLYGVHSDELGVERVVVFEVEEG